MSTLRRRATVVIAGLLLVMVAGCSDDDVVQPAGEDYGTVLQNTTLSVILATYRELDQEAGQLLAGAGALQSAPTTTGLQSARQAWREARVPWENSEAFLFGPVSTYGIDPAIDSWPVNTVDLDAVLAGADSLTEAYVNGLEGTLKGFHTIEYLLFGSSGDKPIGAFTVRELQYLVALTRSLQSETSRLLHAWDPAGEDFGSNLIHAGTQGNALYPSQKAALEELVAGMVAIADEVANGKINDPFVQNDVTLEESRFSANSKADFQDNIRGILFVYAGRPQGPAGETISDVIRRKNPDLDARVRSSIQNSIDRIGAIPGTFTSAIFSNRGAIESAQTAVRDLQQVLEAEVTPFIQSEL
jgi:predicted lipoprotein